MIVLVAAVVLALVLAYAGKWIGASLSAVVALVLFASMFLPTPCNLAELVNGRWVGLVLAYGTSAPGCTL